MIERIYVEKEALHYQRTQDILARYPEAQVLHCDRYTELFNLKAQSFRLQKKSPALILAKKYGPFALKTPEGYGIGQKENYYFSHMLNCLFDCKYCFLQGMYNSANYVLFVNFEDFQNEIRQLCQSTKESIAFFSGYDCDSLAFEGLSSFFSTFYPFFAEQEQALFEIRSKSIQVRALREREPLKNCVIAYTLSPKEVCDELELKAPPLKQRLKVMKELAKRGWKIGLRFDPLIAIDQAKEKYSAFFAEVFEDLPEQAVHSACFGLFRLPKKMFQKAKKSLPKEKLFHSPLLVEAKLVSYEQAYATELLEFTEKALKSYLPQEKLFSTM